MVFFLQGVSSLIAGYSIRTRFRHNQLHNLSPIDLQKANKFSTIFLYYCLFSLVTNLVLGCLVILPPEPLAVQVCLVLTLTMYNPMVSIYLISAFFITLVDILKGNVIMHQLKSSLKNGSLTINEFILARKKIYALSNVSFWTSSSTIVVCIACITPSCLPCVFLMSSY